MSGLSGQFWRRLGKVYAYVWQMLSVVPAQSYLRLKRPANRACLVGSFIRSVAVTFLVINSLLAFFICPTVRSQSVVLAWTPSPDTSVAGYKIYFGTVSHQYTNIVLVGNATQTTLAGLNYNATYYFAATTYDASGNESPFSSETSFFVRLAPLVNPASLIIPTPTINAVNAVVLAENAGPKTVELSGITFPGAPKSSSTLSLTAESSNPSLIPNPVVTYSSPGSYGTLTLHPVQYASGSATISIILNDGASTNGTTVKTFPVTVQAGDNAVAAVTASLKLTVPQTVISPTSLMLSSPVVNQSGFSFLATGSSNVSCVVQSSSDRVTWVNLQTNTTPFLFTDSNTVASSQRFYRTRLLP